MWTGKLGVGSSGNNYVLLEPEKNKAEMELFLERHPEVSLDDIRSAVKSYFSTVKSMDNKYMYAFKSNTFLANNIDSYLPSKQVKMNKMTVVEDCYFKDL
jgi:hypothetical protein